MGESLTHETRKRLLMSRASCALPSAAGACPLPPLVVRHVSPTDGQLLGRLLHAAYLGTIDDEGQSEEEAWQEAAETFMGRYGPMIWRGSFIVLADETRAVSASVVTANEKLGTLLAFALTHPAYQKKGLASLLIEKSLDGLYAAAIGELSLVVTVGNDGAISLYRKLGFNEIEY
jgi:ribosomal protein S18 acetylase RimI-like enzyme